MLCILHDPWCKDIISFVKLNGDHFGVDVKRNGDHFGVGIISGSIWGSFRGRDHFGGCTYHAWATRDFTSLTLSNVGELSWGCIPKNNIWVHKEKENLVFASLRSLQNVTLGIFMLWSCTEGKEMCIKVACTSLPGCCLLIQTYLVVRKGLEKSLNFPQKSLNIFESSLNKNYLR